MTSDPAQLDSARNLADDAMARLYHRGLFRGHPAKPYYESIDGVGHLLYAFVQLDQTLQAKAGKVSPSRIGVLGRARIDNW